MNPSEIVAGEAHEKVILMKTWPTNVTKRAAFAAGWNNQ